MTRWPFSFCIFCVASWFSLSFPVYAGQYVCDQAAGSQDLAIRNAYASKIDLVIRIALAAQAKGFNPYMFPQPDSSAPGGVIFINLPAQAQSLAIQRDNGLRSVYNAWQQCNAGFAPYQQIFDVGTYFMTGGLSAVMPPAMTHIDVSNIVAGTPFGGPDAVLPKTRDDALNRIGIGGDVAKVIRNPRCLFGC